MVKDMMISIVSPRRKSMGGLFIQKEIGQGGMGGWNRVFYMGSNMKLCKEGRNVS